ncbi:MAG: hypothetical protein C4527_24895 [Candidatus Omnitrophota bacterium]|jgi:hypothetical protein|nr:MAG: hypothetical protein C4527_24895 [Candidatus Omnitrophota bacterium]
MAFATEIDVRQNGLLDKFDAVTSEQIQLCLAKAHQEILDGTTLTDGSPVTMAMVTAEVQLALSHLFQSLVVSSAISAREIRISGVRIDSQARIQNLMKLSQDFWEQAWGMLSPYIETSIPGLILARKTE